MNRLKAGLREPLVLFLGAGALLYACYGVFDKRASAHVDSRQIVVDRKALLEFMQFRSKAFEPGIFAKRLDEMSADEREKLTKDYVQEEILYREAVSLGLESGDYIIRQRMIQKLKFLIDEAMDPASVPSTPELEAYYKQHSSDYAEPPIYTFTHVFYDKTQRADAHADAVVGLKELTAEDARFNDAIRYGDRPLYFQNYVERTRDFVVDQFGAEMIAALDRLPPSDKTWRGPFESQYGWHLVLLMKREHGRAPPLEEVRTRVAEDYKVYLAGKSRDVAIARLAKQYRVVQEEASK
jgi:hypothetical protein